MDEALLVLRLLLGLLMAGHGCQKLFGWFRGAGIRGTAAQFESWGLRPGVPMATVAGLTELTAAGLMAAGALVSVAATMIMAAMMVAGAVSRKEGLWAHLGGYETALLYGVMALVICIAGAGSYSLDYALGLPMPAGVGWSLLALLLAILAAAPSLAKLLATQRHA
ncbi:DoxX family protein [Paenarthrobacter aromaticivorans]|uniref:DoxX family protein n=1 Tax=Paenarthrobacter aromaticivorans TaxID=2849150 RepID=UPI003A7F69A4